ncbi:MAG: site-specific DNA-methyltransferase [Chloroflexaceae bacterium]|nr:site-specific DNA-methyltransferase [Chloroflexaceae bacterium]
MAKRASLNALAREDYPIHNWYRFVLSFPPHLVRTYLKRFGANRNTLVLDPFCGTGTTLVECKKLGIPGIGIEAHPMSFFASKVKIDWEVDPDGLERHAECVAAKALADLQNTGIPDIPIRFSGEENLQTRSLPLEQHKLLLAHSISPLPLYKTLVLLDALIQDKNPCYEQYERLALAKALISSISNLYFGPEVGVGTIKKDAAVIEPWLKGVQTMVNDLKVLSDRDVPSQVLQGDARSLPGLLPRQSVDMVITSPPYPNEKDYTRTTRLESVLLGFLQTRSDLRSVKHQLLCSNTRTVYKDNHDDRYITDQSKIQELADSIEMRRIELGKTSGFERLYARTTRLYFGGMYRHLADLRDVLRPGAYLAYVVGDQASYFRIPIRTGALLASLAESLGYEAIGIDLFRTRLATSTREHLREEVVLLRWMGSK